MEIRNTGGSYKSEESAKNAGKVFARMVRKCGYSRISLLPGSTVYFGYAPAGDGFIWRAHMNVSESSKGRLIKCINNLVPICSDGFTVDLIDHNKIARRVR